MLKGVALIAALNIPTKNKRPPKNYSADTPCRKKFMRNTAPDANVIKSLAEASITEMEELSKAEDEKVTPTKNGLKN